MVTEDLVLALAFRSELITCTNHKNTSTIRHIYAGVVEKLTVEGVDRRWTSRQ